MEINAGITILCSKEKITIEIYDNEAHTQFVEVILTPEQWAQALSRLSNTPCEKTIITHLERVGKKAEHDTFEFQMPHGSQYDPKIKEIARDLARKLCPEGWVPDAYFGSHNSFFYRGDEQYARTTIRRWV